MYFFDPLLTGHVIRRMHTNRERIFNGNQRETLSLITQERIGVGASNLVNWVKQTWSKNMADIQHK